MMNRPVSRRGVVRTLSLAIAAAGVGGRRASGAEPQKLDVKDPAAAQPIIDITRAVGDPARTWLCSPDLEHLRALRPDAPDVRLVHSTPRRRLPDSLERHAADLAAAGVDAMNLRHSEWTKGLVALFHRFNLRAFAWDVQEVRHLRAMLTIGIDAVYCDNVERMVATVAEWEPS